MKRRNNDDSKIKKLLAFSFLIVFAIAVTPNHVMPASVANNMIIQKIHSYRDYGVAWLNKRYAPENLTKTNELNKGTGYKVNDRKTLDQLIKQADH